MIQAIVSVVFLSGCGLAFVWLGRQMDAGRIDPTMGSHTVENTTPDSWRATQVAIGRAIAICGWSWVLAGVVMVFVVPIGLVLLIGSTVLLVVQIARAATLLEPIR